MIGPLVDSGIISGFTDLVLAFLVGILFGFILEQAGLSSGRKITAVFYGRDFAVPKVMFVSMITASTGLLLLHMLGFLDATKVFLPPTFVWSLIIGGLIFGVGMVVSGYCPGTAVVASSIGRLDAMAAILGMFVGMFLFAETSPLFWNFFYSGALGKKSLVEVFGIPAGFTVLLLLLFALGFFGFAKVMEAKFGGHKQSTYGPWNITTAKWVVSFAVIFCVLAGFSTLLAVVPGKASVEIQGEEYVAALPEQINAIEAKDLEKLINGGLEPFVLIDVRSKEDYERGALPGSYNMPAMELMTQEGLSSLPADRMIILCDEDGALVFQLLPFLRANRVDAHGLAGGLMAWGQMKTGGQGGVKLEAPMVKTPAPPAELKKGKSKTGFKDEGC